MFWELPLAMHQAPSGALLRNNKKKNPSNPSNPLHPDETSVSVACPSGSSVTGANAAEKASRLDRILQCRTDNFSELHSSR
jgi:hypothetical protein